MHRRTVTATQQQSSAHPLPLRTVADGAAAAAAPPPRKVRRVRRGRRTHHGPWCSKWEKLMLLDDSDDKDKLQELLNLAIQILIVLILVVLLLLVSLSAYQRLWMPESKRSIFDPLTFKLPKATGSQYIRPESQKDKTFDILRPSKVYSIPHSMPHIGDKSDRYAELRQVVDTRMERATFETSIPSRRYDDISFFPMMKDSMISNSDHLHHAAASPSAYDIYNCPEEPPMGYPFEWNLLDILDNWPVDDTNVPSHIYQGLCVFDYNEDYEKALRYRQAELPFVVHNDPRVQATVQRWNAPHYLAQLLGRVKHRAEYSTNNHFLYWNAPRKKKGLMGGGKKIPADWKEPTELLRMTYVDWLAKANITDEERLQPDQPHWYFRLIGCGETGPKGECDAGSSEYLFDELPYFQPRPSLYIVDGDEQKGIHCRFGMKGVIAENHFDASRNAIVVLGGSRRYILNHPNQCENLHLWPKGHPSARHSSVDWAHPPAKDADDDNFPNFRHATGNEVILQAGDVMYLPMNWFHFIVSLELNYQCNTRSGISPEYIAPIRDCGF